MIAYRHPLPLGRTLVLGAAGTAAFLALWAGVAASGLVLHTFLPSPLEVMERFVTLLTTPFAGRRCALICSRAFSASWPVFSWRSPWVCPSVC